MTSGLMPRLLELVRPRPVRDIVQPPTVVWPGPGLRLRWRDRRRTCPNCGSRAPKPHVLRVFASSPGHPMRRRDVLRCPDCTARFMNTLATPDYADEDMLRRGRVAFYVQQGAGVSLITRPLAQLQSPPGSAYMEVGCGYGFGLDFALRAKGWQGYGSDPARLSALGRDALDVPIEQRYLRDDDEARGTMDVVMGSEVIEHVPSPRAFVRTLRAMLRPGGVLALTTPNGEDLVPETPPGALVPLLSPGLHLVIQTPRSLRRLLLEAGFAHAQVSTDSHALIAYASDTRLPLDTDALTMRQAYRTHLETRAASLDPAGDACLGYAGRALQEAVNDSDTAVADCAWAMLLPACQARFGLDLDAIETLPPDAASCSLEAMSGLMPLALGGILYADAMRRLQSGAPRPGLEQRFALAADAAQAMRRALGELAMEDGQTEDIGWTARAEALLCGAEAGRAGLAERLSALPPAPSDGAARRAAVVQRMLIALVNAGHLDLAREVAASEALTGAAFDGPMTASERDALFALAMLDVQGDSPDLTRAALRFRRVREAAEPGSGLMWAALRGEALALDRMGAARRAAGLLTWAARAGAPDDMRAQLDRAADILAEPPGEADVLAAAEAGDPWTADEMRRLPAGPGRSALMRHVLVLLVNSGHVEAARGVADAERLWEAPLDTGDAGERDALFALAVLDAGIGPDGRPFGDPARARDGFVRVRAAAEPGSGLCWAALRGELQALDLLGRSDEGVTLVAGLAASGLPEDILARLPQPAQEA